MKLIMIVILPFLMNTTYASETNSKSIIPLSEVEQNKYRNHFYKALKSSESLIKSSRYDVFELKRIGLRVGLSLEVGIGPFSIEGETQHRFIYKLQ